MRLKLRSYAERLRANLFFVPMIAVVIAIGVGVACLALDRRIDANQSKLPLGLTSTVDSARTLLSTIAGATITFAGIAFSVSLLTIQLASSQFSPRVVHTLFRDTFNRRVMALVVGTFTYCLIVLRSVRSSLEEGGRPVIPNVSVALAVVLGIITILAIVAFINHSAHSMDVSEILERIRRESIDQLRDEWDVSDQGEASPVVRELGDDYHVIRFDRTGWVQELDTDALLEAIPERTGVRLETCAGRYAIAGTRLCVVSPTPDQEQIERIELMVRACAAVGPTRTMQQDISYGLRQLADVALKALSPGINDPTTAQDAIFHAAAILVEALRRNPPPGHRDGEAGRWLSAPHQPTRDELVTLAFDETRRAAATQPAVCVYLLEALSTVAETLTAANHPGRTFELRRQARLTLDGCEHADLRPLDLEIVRAAYHRAFPDAAADLAAGT